ncbi:MAG TPA: hypothetical protein VMM14_04065 [Acidimicrobiia bacterium]|nr:hypothetical protein [Acidimicrobiia bacterium]
MTNEPDQSRSAGQVLAGALAGLVIGLAGGAAIGSGLTSFSNAVATTAGGVTMALVAGWADATRRPGRPQPLWVRILASVLLAAALGWLLQRLLPDWPLPIAGGLVGAGAAALGARLRKLLIGLMVGLTVGGGFGYFATGEVGWSVVAATTVFVYRLVAGAAYRGREQVHLLGENVAPREVPFVVPLAEKQGYVGVDYLKRHADDVGAVFTHNAPDIGIVESFDELAGPGFDPERAHPSIREFYEHTSRFTLSITPKWRWWMRMPYLLYRETVARPLGQANVPFHLDEVERGVLSWIDTIDVDEDGIPDFRAWVRAYEGSNEPLYVGIYTTVRDEDTGYVSVGFPLPSGSFTATLLPSHFQQDGLRLSSRQGVFQGHYLSALDSETGEVTTVKLEAFDEEIEVYEVDGQLSTDHRFYLGGIEFMSLHYEISRS